MIVQPSSLAGIAGGVFIGVFFGAIPGLTATVGVSLLLPITFFLPPSVGIPLLVGIAKGAAYGGSIPAILISTPGTGAAIATQLDGHPLAQQGRARSALQMALLASVSGDLFATLVTIMFAAQVVKLALLVGRPEFFAILIFSISIIASASGASTATGVMSACVGLMLATVGTDTSGRWRFSFGVPDLASGLEFIPVIIGLVALSVVLERIFERDSGEEAALRQIQEVSKTDRLKWPEAKRCIPAILRGCAVGSFIGAVPGIGQPVAAMLGYSLAKRFSREPEKFGKGALEGVAGPEAANNAVNGPSLLPLLSFGIPGDIITAVLMGAFVAHGLRPGPYLFRDYGDIMYAILLGLVIGNVFLLAMGWSLTGLFAKAATLRRHVILPPVLAMAVMGAYAIRNSLFDVGVMVVFGFIGFLMRRYDFPMTPLLITLLLGRQIEMSLYQTMLLFRGNPLGFLGHPFALALLVSSAAIITAPFISNVLRSARGRRPIHSKRTS